MITEGQLVTILEATCRFLNQNDLGALARTSKALHESVAIKHLYQKVCITKDPVLRSSKWFLDGGKTYLSGYRALKKTDDQNDLFLYDRVERLLDSKHLRYIKELTIQDSVFSDMEACSFLLEKLVEKILGIDEVEIIDIKNDHLFLKYYSKILKLTKLKEIKIIDTDSLNDISSLSTLTSVQWIIENPRLARECFSGRVVHFLSEKLEKCEFIVDNIDSSSFKIINYLGSNGIKCNRLTSLKFNHLYGTNLHNENHGGTSYKWLSRVVNLGLLETLELGISSENIERDCIDEFLEELAPRLKSVRRLGFTETTPVEQSDCTLKETWDLTVNRFILKIPKISQRLHTLSISHKTPLNGLCDNGVQGNYTRRKTLYETVLPELNSLQKLIVPNMLQSLSVYEVLACDILWNGCECDYCAKILPVFDEYIMNHQYYSKLEGRYMDIIPTVFFSYAGDYLSKRFRDRVTWDTEVFDIAPLSRNWNFRGYEHIHHFDNYEDLFDESAFAPLCKVISHFFDSYMDAIVRFLPNLKTAMFSGIYYSVDDERHTYECIYD